VLTCFSKFEYYVGFVSVGWCPWKWVMSVFVSTDTCWFVTSEMQEKDYKACRGRARWKKKKCPSFCCTGTEVIHIIHVNLFHACDFLVPHNLHFAHWNSCWLQLLVRNCFLRLVTFCCLSSLLWQSFASLLLSDYFSFVLALI